MKNLRDMTYAEMLEEVLRLGEKPYRAMQMYAWIYRRRISDIDSMTDISKAFREKMKEEFCISADKVVAVNESVDGTRKFLTELSDSSRVESVLIPEAERLTLCVSTQAGCAMACRFCMTGADGFIRNLTLAEMTGQLFSAFGILKEDERITNIVLMGMGEPLANYDNVVRFTGVLVDTKGLSISHNKVTVSTAGLVPEIKRFATDATVNLAVSLNATTDEVRSRIMPINKKYPIESLMDAMRTYSAGTRKHITIEYVMLKGLNDTLDDARRLARLLKGIPCKINLIPFNPYPGSPFEPPVQEKIVSFASIIKEAGLVAVVRASKGADIQAACGQLKGSYE